ncbi:hypothetical protein BY996DRAFT_7243157, partial [Phakopsora pachyrhizi]
MYFKIGIDMGRNICHGSDSVESAKKEIGSVSQLSFSHRKVFFFKKKINVT